MSPSSQQKQSSPRRDWQVEVRYQDSNPRVYWHHLACGASVTPANDRLWFMFDPTLATGMQAELASARAARLQGRAGQDAIVVGNGGKERE